MVDLERNIHIVQARIADAAARANRDPNDITLVAVSKTFPPEAIIAAHELGIRNFGENRVEEALEKIPNVEKRLTTTRPTEQSTNQSSNHPINRRIWHLVGHLQSRKVKDAVLLFDCIHSIDSVQLAERVDRNATILGKVIPVLLEVNISGEVSKYGFGPEPNAAFFSAVAAILKLEHLDVQGLMTIAPIVATPNDARPFFRNLCMLRDELCSQFPNRAFRHLSMGMTDDFQVAIEEGATMVRIGRAIFGERAQEQTH